MRRIVREITPPVFWRAARQLRSFLTAQKPDYIEWEYIPDGWERAKNVPDIKGWNVESILDAYKSNWNNFLSSLEGTLPFGIHPESDSASRNNLIFHNLIMSYAYTLALVSRKKSSISMLDWGGAIGHYYLISKKLMPDLMIDYHCKDVPILAEYGQKLFTEAHFYSDETCLERKYDFVLASGSLQYSQDWNSVLEKLASATSRYLFITRLPVAQHVSSFVIVQRPYRYGYNTEYLGWCFNREKFIMVAKSYGLNLIREFVVESPLNVHLAPEQPEQWGFLFSRTN
jgi:putative methyltransferase (TIGR04325 family)